MEEQREKKQGHKGKGQKYKSLLVWDILQKRTDGTGGYAVCYLGLQNMAAPSVKIPTPSRSKNAPPCGKSDPRGGRGISKLGFLHQKRPTAFAAVFFVGRGEGSEPIKCNTPVGCCGHQFKNWWLPYISPPKRGNGHRIPHPLS